MRTLPLLLEPEELYESSGYDNVLIVDMSAPSTYAQLHVPGAVHLGYDAIVTARKPVLGLLPDAATLNRVLSAVGIDRDTHVIAYDDACGGKASRLLWTLSAAGHEHYSLLNGGLHAWANEGFPHTAEAVMPAPSDFSTQRNDASIAETEDVRSCMDIDDCRILDVRSPAEYSGEKKLAERAGHIPGAINIEWTRTMDRTRNLRLLPDDELRGLFADADIEPEHTVVCHCQSHHRSAHTWFVLRHLGYERVKGYPGSWSLWGNDPSLPVEN